MLVPCQKKDSGTGSDRCMLVSKWRDLSGSECSDKNNWSCGENKDKGKNKR